MTPAGLEKIAASKQDGSWNSYDAIEQLIIPTDLQDRKRCLAVCQQERVEPVAFTFPSAGG